MEIQSLLRGLFNYVHTSDWVNLSMYNLGLVAAVPTLKVDLGSTILGDVRSALLRRNIPILSWLYRRLHNIGFNNSISCIASHISTPLLPQRLLSTLLLIEAREQARMG